MQSYPLNLTPASSGRVYGATANLFVYESGESAGDTRIIVKPDSGSEITVRPGQRFRLPPGQSALQWSVRLYDPASSIVGSIIIGSGEFDDANTNNIVTLAEGFSNNVRVNNTPQERIPVALDTTQTQPVSLTGTKITNTTAERVPISLDPGQVFNTSENVVSYNKSFSMRTPLAQNTPVAVVTAAENVNGAILRMYRQSASSASSPCAVALIAKATAPANIADGDLMASTYLTSSIVSYETTKQISIPPGKGLWLFAEYAEATALRHALVTLL